MAELTNAIKNIDGKLRFLEFLGEETEEIIEKNERKSITRQIKAYESKLEEIEELKLNIQELKIQAEEEPQEGDMAAAEEPKDEDGLVASSFTSALQRPRFARKGFIPELHHVSTVQLTTLEGWCGVRNIQTENVKKIEISNKEKATHIERGNASDVEEGLLKSTRERRSLRDLYEKKVLQAELYARKGRKGKGYNHYGVVITTKGGQRWLVHKGHNFSRHGDTVITKASHMSKRWQLIEKRKVKTATVLDFIRAGGSFFHPVHDNAYHAAKRMMNLGQ
eukprot:gene15231-16806_t